MRTIKTYFQLKRHYKFLGKAAIFLRENPSKASDIDFKKHFHEIISMLETKNYDIVIAFGEYLYVIRGTVDWYRKESHKPADEIKLLEKLGYSDEAFSLLCKSINIEWQNEVTLKTLFWSPATICNIPIEKIKERK